MNKCALCKHTFESPYKQKIAESREWKGYTIPEVYRDVCPNCVSEEIYTLADKEREPLLYRIAFGEVDSEGNWEFKRHASPHELRLLRVTTSGKVEQLTMQPVDEESEERFNIIKEISFYGKAHLLHWKDVSDRYKQELGIKFKNGVIVYDNDICFDESYAEETFLVEFSEGNFTMRFYKDQERSYLLYTDRNLRVLGYYFNNPNLLNTKHRMRYL